MDIQPAVRVGTRIPTGDCDRDEFRQRVFAGWDAYQGAGGAE